MNEHKQQASKELLVVKNLQMSFPVGGDVLGRNKQYVHAVDGVSFSINEGETLGIVGESGCGKSTVGNLIVRLLKETDGQIFFEGQEITAMSQRALKPFRKEMQMVFQDPFSSLNPRKKAFDIIAEPYRVQTKMTRQEIRHNVERMMGLVGLDKSYMNRYPHEFSGGQRQRICIARALALNPKLVICDEPVSALDVSIQAQILNLLKDLQDELGLTYVFIAHGLPTVQHISDRIAVMYLGKIMELATNQDLFAHTLHPYTQGLLSAIPIADPSLRSDKEEVILEGDMPSPLHLPAGCRFCSRCKYAQPLCSQQEPEMREILPGHYACCHFPLEQPSWPSIQKDAIFRKDKT